MTRDAQEGVEPPSDVGEWKKRWRERPPTLVVLAVFLSVVALVGLIVAVVLNMAPRPAEPKSSPEVDLGYAAYTGIRRDGGVDVYRGMRYARPPLGDLRWRAPVEPERQEGTQKANDVSLVIWLLGGP
jgi:hypothetical protein